MQLRRGRRRLQEEVLTMPIVAFSGEGLILLVLAAILAALGGWKARGLYHRIKEKHHE